MAAQPIQYNRKVVRTEALEVPQICADIIHTPPDVTRDIPEDMLLADTSLNNNECENGISLLIGADHYWDVVSGSVRRLKTRLMAVDTILGWTLQGPMSSRSYTAIYSSITGVMKVTTADTTEISTQLRSFWELEHIGIKEQETSTNEIAPFEDFKKKVKYEDGRYQVFLPWNDKVEMLKDNKENAERRLRSLTGRLMKNKALMRDYDTAIREYFGNGFAEKVRSIEKKRKSCILHATPSGCATGTTDNKIAGGIRRVLQRCRGTFSE